MNTPAEIVAAIDALPEPQRAAVENLIVTRRVLAGCDRDEREELIKSLAEAEAELDAGKAYSADEVRRMLPSWLGK